MSIKPFWTFMLWTIAIVWIPLFVAKHTWHTATNTTVYVSHSGVYCDIAQREKCGYTLINCEDHQTFICETNVEMKVNK